MVTEVFLSSWCQDRSSGRVPSGSTCPWLHRTEFGTALEKQRWASFLQISHSREALDPHKTSVCYTVCDCRSQRGNLQTVNSWLPTMLQLVMPGSIKTRETVSNKQRQSVRVWVSQNHIYSKKKNVQARGVASIPHIKNNRSLITCFTVWNQTLKYNKTY